MKKSALSRMIPGAPDPTVDLEAFLAFHRDQFGDFRMEDDDADDDSDDDDSDDDDADDDDADDKDKDKDKDAKSKKDDKAGDDKDDDWKSPESKKAALADLSKERNRRKQVEKDLADLKKKNESDAEKAVREAREEAEKEVGGKYKKIIVKSEARSALLEAGLTVGTERFVKMIDVDKIEIDDESGDISGLDDQIADIKKDFPELFSKKPGSRLNAGSDRTPASKKKSSAQLLAERLGASA